MPVQFKCQECDSPLKAPDAARGKLIACKSCGAKVRVPGGKKKAPPKKRPPKRKSDDDFLSGSVDAEDRRFTVCQKCGEQYQGNDPICPYCGYDHESRSLTKEARRRELKKTGRLDQGEFFETAKGTSLKYLFDQVPFALRSGLYVLLPGLCAIASFFLVLYNGNTPPKVFFGFLATVFSLATVGWLFTLAQVVTRSTLEGQEKLKRVSYDFFSAAADGVSFISLQVAYLFPASLAMVGAYLYGEDMHGLGIGLMLLGPILMAPFYPLILAHLAMPVNWPAWLFTKALGLFGKVSGASMYWVLFTFVALLPATIATGVTVGVFGEDVSTVMTELTYNGKLAYEQYLASRGEGQAPPGEPLEVQYELLIAPGIITAFALFYTGFAWLYPSRIIGLMAMYFKRDLELIQEKKEREYVAKERRIDDDGNVVVSRGGGGAGMVILIRIGGTIMFYVVVAVSSYFISGGEYILVPRPVAALMGLIEE